MGFFNLVINTVDHKRDACCIIEVVLGLQFKQGNAESYSLTIMLELLLFPVMGAQKDTTAIQILEEQKVELVIPEPTEPVITPEEQLELDIKNNVNNCNEELYWISAENATCLPKRVQTTNRTTTAQNTARGAVNGSQAPSGWYPKYQCTWHVWTKRAVGQWNNATDWLWQAQRDGYATGSTPRVGAIGWQHGHVVYIEAVKGDMVYISERNYDNAGSYRETWKPASDYTYIY